MFLSHKHCFTANVTLDDLQMNIQPKEQECLVLVEVRMTIMKRMYKCSLSNVRVWIDHGSENYSF